MNKNLSRSIEPADTPQLSRESSMLLELAYNSKEKVLSLTGRSIKGDSPAKM